MPIHILNASHIAHELDVLYLLCMCNNNGIHYMYDCIFFSMYILHTYNIILRSVVVMVLVEEVTSKGAMGRTL